MIFKMWFDEEYLCRKISSKEGMGNLLDAIRHTECFDFEYAIREEQFQEIYESLYQYRKSSGVRELDIWIDRHWHSFSYLTAEEGMGLLHELWQCEAEECRNERDILKQKNGVRFGFETRLMVLSDGETLRRVSSDEEFKKVMAVFGLCIHIEEEFVPFIKDLFRGLLFDDELQDSMKSLDLGFEKRKAEILEHLLVLELELPDLIKGNGCSNQEIGDRLSVPCSPERKRDIVRKYLAKRADDGEPFYCELHTKMKKVGDHPPDRIYFCAKVPKGIALNGQDIGGRTYIYKISKHV